MRQLLTKSGNSAHVPTDELLRAFDGELSEAQTARVELHVAACETCRASLHDLGLLSVRLEGWSAGVVVPEDPAARTALAQRCAAAESTFVVARGSSRPLTLGLWHWTASAAVAAALLLAAMLSPALRNLQAGDGARTTDSSSSQSFQIAGETFQALPYSNADLPLASPHIVRMEVPVTSLTEAGLVFESVSSEQANPDRAVLADVLLGTDGEPLGVHVLSGE